MKKIIYSTPLGVSVVHPTGEVPFEVVLVKDVPPDADYEVVDESKIPADRLFRKAWRKEGSEVVVPLDLAKEAAHDIRRALRDIEMAPLDVKVGVPSQAVQAELERKNIRDKYADIQNQVDAANDVSTLKAVIEPLKNSILNAR